METEGTQNAQQAAVDATHEVDVMEQILAEAQADDAAAKLVGTLVPVTIKNVDLEIQVRMGKGQTPEMLNGITDILARMRQTFGEHVLIEELTRLTHGQIESIAITGRGAAQQPTGVSQTQAPQQHPQAPRPAWFGWAIQTPGKLKGMELQQIDPRTIYGILSDPAKVAMGHPQDVQMMKAYYNDYAAKQGGNPQIASQQSFAADQVPHY